MPPKGTKRKAAGAAAAAPAVAAAAAAAAAVPKLTAEEATLLLKIKEIEDQGAGENRPPACPASSACRSDLLPRAAAASRPGRARPPPCAVNAYEELLRNELAEIQAEITKIHSVSAMRLSKDVRSMTMREFIVDHGGDTNVVRDKTLKAARCVAFAAGAARPPSVLRAAPLLTAASHLTLPRPLPRSARARAPAPPRRRPAAAATRAPWRAARRWAARGRPARHPAWEGWDCRRVAARAQCALRGCCSRGPPLAALRQRWWPRPHLPPPPPTPLHVTTRSCPPPRCPGCMRRPPPAAAAALAPVARWPRPRLGGRAASLAAAAAASSRGVAR